MPTDAHTIKCNICGYEHQFSEGKISVQMKEVSIEMHGGEVAKMKLPHFYYSCPKCDATSIIP